MRRCWRANLVLAVWFVTCGAMPSAAETFDSIYISEVLVENQGSKGANAEKGHGWIELHNGGSSSVSLADWTLSDSPTNLAKWTFPRVVMLPDSYMLITASGVGNTNDLADLHA